MTDTSTSYFTNVTQSAPGVGTPETWSDLTNVLAELGEASATLSTPTSITNFMVLDTPQFVVPVPDASRIDNIRIRIRAEGSSNPDSQSQIIFVSIAGGPNKTGPILDGVMTTYTIEGDLSFWGITNEQAMDFANGSEVFRFVIDHIGTLFNYPVDVQWVDCQITYLAQVPLPALF